jgi:bacterioferritin-associated ferredoxin
VYICICNAITEGQVRECAQGGTCSLEELASALGVGSGCGRCRDCAEQVLAETEAE